MQTQDVRHENLKMVMQELKKSFKDAPDELTISLDGRFPIPL